MKNKSQSSRRWLHRHVSDPFVQRSVKEGYRSRAVYKLQAIDEKERLLKRGQVVVDLGAAPGSWSQWAASRVGEQGLVVALDLLTMQPLPHVHVIQGDFRLDAVLQELTSVLSGRQVDVVLCDIAPNMSGVNIVDQPRMMHLAELVLDFAEQVLPESGALLIKVFQGAGLEDYVKRLRSSFQEVKYCKPEASRASSRERYLLARKFQRRAE